ncbi:hypothetical protein CDIK_2760 [Cucumispora dikerogammari]|nr:hypothetical protein CDIK_2760 [Cucumispora dikerogammari]
MRSSRGRALIGRQAVSIVPFIRRRNISVCAAINIQGILHYETKQCAYKSLLFKQFLINLFETLRSQNKTNAIFIMDNVRFHKTSEIKEIFVNSKYECFYLPPYSSFLNSIKNMFSKWKKHVKRGTPCNEDELINFISSGTNIITTSDCEEYYRKMMSYIPKSLRNEVIMD